MPTTIITSDRQVYRHAKAIVSIADALRDQDFVEVPYLRCETLRITVAPEIDQAVLSYQYGTMAREDTWQYFDYSKLNLQGKFVKVVVHDTVYADAFAADPETAEVDQSIVWFGRIEFNTENTRGTITVPPGLPEPQGTQQFTAFGLLRLAELWELRNSWVDQDGTKDNLRFVYSGLTFNNDPCGEFIARGNRSSIKPTGSPDSPSYVFAWQPRGFEEWTAYTAVEYLLAYHSPLDTSGHPANVWKFADDVDEDFLDWYKITQPTHGMTLKALLDALMPRFRGVGYWLSLDITRTDEEDPETAANVVLVHVFTFNKTDISLPNSEVLKANPNQRSLDFEFAYDIEDATVTNVSPQYDRIVGQGAKRTTTFTTRISALDSSGPFVILGPAWTSANEAEYKAGASAATDYGSLTTDQQEKRNSVYRKSNDRLKQVFRRYVLNTQQDDDKRWDGKIPRPHTSASDKPYYWLRGQQGNSPFSALVEEGDDYDGTDYVPALRIRRSLPLYERVDYSGTNLAGLSYDTTTGTHPSFIPLMAYVRTSTGDGEAADITPGQKPHRYQLVDRLHQAAYFATERTWACQVGVVDTEPGIELVAETPHFLGDRNGGGAGYAATADSEKSALQGGVDYTDAWVTMCVELCEHLTFQETLSSPAPPIPEQVLIIHVPDARHDYVLPYTVVEIKDGLPVQTTSGGLTGDGRARLEAIVKTAAQWYSTVRQALQLKWKQTRASFRLGDLITDVGGRYQLTDVNTPVTAITYDLGGDHEPGSPSAGTTTIETAFTNLDFQT